MRPVQAVCRECAETSVELLGVDFNNSWIIHHWGINTIPSNTPKFLHVVVWLALWWASSRISQQHVRTQTIPTHQHLIACSMQGKDWGIWSCAVPSGRQMVDTQAVEPNEESQCPTCSVSCQLSTSMYYQPGRIRNNFTWMCHEWTAF